MRSLAVLMALLCGCQQGHDTVKTAETVAPEVKQPPARMAPPRAEAEVAPMAKEITMNNSQLHPIKLPKQGSIKVKGLLEAELVIHGLEEKGLKVTLEVSNPNQYGVPLRFNSGMTADLWLLAADGKRLWAWSNDMMFTQALRDLVMAAGASYRLTFMVPRKELNRGGTMLKAVFAGKPTESRLEALPEILLPL
ncbi:BsuPI-related putative proteinase inhibitor [Shewanella sedimentimangrovi]|uniref:Intracellular proteinase inhibitor BsuPI domain-containing protein n=1 Tax=Shewanella sedimentimangrovi TaxID=2814293 RepID=A0ABX7R7P4_9GAMM|nr:BsuPI-related putative proteinase inhibitor [Shewanella sedimentimangrovi]QSX38796.1 hypothetical protein JYB85_08330 [Shewanella sedimentimangrovi]